MIGKTLGRDRVLRLESSVEDLPSEKWKNQTHSIGGEIMSHMAEHRLM